MTQGIIIIVAVSLAITVVNIFISNMTIKDIKGEYDTMLNNRKAQNRDLLVKLTELTEKNANLEAQLTLERVNKPQAEFFEVPKVKK